MPFTVHDISDQTGRLVVITGATGGLGYETALALAGAKATVVLTGRNSQKGADAVAAIRAVHPLADVSYEQLDLTRLSAVGEFADQFMARHDRLDILINNAGVMALPQRTTTPDGFETQFQTNYLSHFALTARLLPLLARARARLVQLSSLMAARGHIDFHDLQEVRGYRPYKAYGQSKLAMLMFGLELQRRSDAHGWGLTSTIAHPGVSATNLIMNGTAGTGLRRALTGFLTTYVTPLLLQPPSAGALPQIMAATQAQVVPAGYYGPDGPGAWRGRPTLVQPPARALDTAVAERLWTQSEQLTGHLFALDKATA